LENLAEFYIFIWGTAPGGDEDIWAIKIFSGWMQIQKMREAFPILTVNQGCFTFCQKLFRSNDHILKKIFGQMNFRPNKISVK
jgi:hypothetical protein